MACGLTRPGRSPNLKAMNTQQDPAAAFPTFDDAQMATLARCAGASVKTYATGQTLIRVGERDFEFFVDRDRRRVEGGAEGACGAGARRAHR
jgi:hypothetical protein